MTLFAIALAAGLAMSYATSARFGVHFPSPSISSSPATSAAAFTSSASKNRDQRGDGTPTERWLETGDMCHRKISPTT